MKKTKNTLAKTARKALCASVFFIVASMVQASSADDAPFGTKPTLLLSSAKQAADACESMAQAMGLQLSIAIVDDGARLILFRRMSGASLASADIARGKAETAVRIASSTRGITEYIHGKEGQAAVSSGLAYLPGIVSMVGGLPIKINNQLIGGIGVSGATGDQDETCGQAGIDSLRIKK